LSEIAFSDEPKASLQAVLRRANTVFVETVRLNLVPSQLDIFINDLSESRKRAEDLDAQDRGELLNKLNAAEQRAGKIRGTHSVAVRSLSSTKQAFESWVILAEATASVTGETDADAVVRKLAVKEGVKLGLDLRPKPAQSQVGSKNESQPGGGPVQSVTPVRTESARETALNQPKQNMPLTAPSSEGRALSVRDLEGMSGGVTRNARLSGRFLVLSWGTGTISLAPEPGAASPNVKVEVQVRCSGKVQIMNLLSGRWQGADIAEAACVDLGKLPLSLIVISVERTSPGTLKVVCGLDGDAFWPNLPKLKTLQQ
jgi:hypothetical protein